jgi:hypothetical protein
MANSTYREQGEGEGDGGWRMEESEEEGGIDMVPFLLM